METAIHGIISAQELATSSMVSRNATRESLHNIHVTDIFTEGTDGTMLVRVKRSPITDLEPGVYKHSQKGVKGKCESVTFVNGTDTRGKNGTLISIEETYPCTDILVRNIITSGNEENEKGEKKGYTVSIALNAALLLKLAKVLNHNMSNDTKGHVRMDINVAEQDSPILVQGQDSNSVGVLMPIRDAKNSFISPLENLKETVPVVKTDSLVRDDIQGEAKRIVA